MMFLDLIYVALFAVVLPLIDYLVYWPAFRRRSQIDPAGARKRLWKSAIWSGWVVVAVGAALWVTSNRTWTSFGFTVPGGWRLWTAIALVVLLAAYYVSAVWALVRSSDARASLRQQIGELSVVLPHTQREMFWFAGVSLTAGFCEEFLYRGYFVWALSPWLGQWAAAALSLAFFDSLWPAIALHVLVDLGSGTMSWLALREGLVKCDVLEIEPDNVRSGS
jgi:membrane protease YdiL (CAAX protease family)